MFFTCYVAVFLLLYWMRADMSAQHKDAIVCVMMMSPHGNTFCITDLLWGDPLVIDGYASQKNTFRVSSGQGKVREIPYQAKVRELSGNFVMGQGKLKMLGKVREFWTGHCYGSFMSNLKHFGQHPHSLLMDMMELLASVTWMSSSYDSLNISSKL